MVVNVVEPLSDATWQGFFLAVRAFAEAFSAQDHRALYGITDGKAVGTFIERRFQDHLINANITLVRGNAARGIDLPAFNTDIKVTSLRQPQSSSPFTTYRQKIEGLGYHLLLFVYTKHDVADHSRISFATIRFIPQGLTADYQTTKGILDIIGRGGNADDLFAFLIERMIPVDEVTLAQYAQELLTHPPRQGYLTISNALQWRLQYNRLIGDSIEGIVTIVPEEGT